MWLFPGVVQGRQTTSSILGVGRWGSTHSLMSLTICVISSTRSFFLLGLNNFRHKGGVGLGESQAPSNSERTEVIHSLILDCSQYLCSNLRYRVWTSDSYCEFPANYDSFLILTMDSLLTLGKRHSFGLLISIYRKLFPTLLCISFIYFIFKMSIKSTEEIDTGGKIITVIICNLFFLFALKELNSIFGLIVENFSQKTF